jgi:hypothetical protein
MPYLSASNSPWSIFLSREREMSMQKVIDDALFMMVMKDFKLLPIVEDRF